MRPHSLSLSLSLSSATVSTCCGRAGQFRIDGGPGPHRAWSHLLAVINRGVPPPIPPQHTHTRARARARARTRCLHYTSKPPIPDVFSNQPPLQDSPLTFGLIYPHPPPTRPDALDPEASLTLAFNPLLTLALTLAQTLMHTHSHSHSNLFLTCTRFQLTFAFNPRCVCVCDTRTHPHSPKHAPVLGGQ